MSITRKDFKALAAALKNERMSMPKKPLPGDDSALTVHWATLDFAILAIALVCKDSNPAFDAERFKLAAGYNTKPEAK